MQAEECAMSKKMNLILPKGIQYAETEDKMINRTLRQMIVIAIIVTFLMATNTAQARQVVTDGLISYWSLQ